jgi:hypothetical protein
MTQVNYVTYLGSYQNRMNRKEIKLDKGFTLNQKPYEYMADRYKEVINIYNQAKQLGGNGCDQHWSQLEKLVGSSCTGYLKYMIYSGTKEDLNKDYIAEQVHNKVLYWNVYNNNSRLFIATIDLDDIMYETGSSVNLNKYFDDDVQLFIKALMDTDALLIIKDLEGHKLAKYVFHKGEHSWDYKNEMWNELIKDIIFESSQVGFSREIVDPIIVDRYKGLMTQYSNLDMSTRREVVDYNTRFFYSEKATVREVDVLTYTFLKENYLLEEKVDIDKLDQQLEKIVEAIKSTDDKGMQLALAHMYLKLDTQRSRELSAEDVGYNDTISEDFEESVEDVVMNHETNREIESYRKFMEKY